MRRPSSNSGRRLLFALLALAVAITATGCSGYNDYWKAKADIKRAEADRIREDTRHREEMHYITEANAAKAGPVLAYTFLALVIGGVVIALVYTGGQPTAQVVKAHASARDVRPDARGLLPVRVSAVADSRPRGLLSALAYLHHDASALGPLLRSSRKDGRLHDAGMTVRAITARVRTLGKSIGVDVLSAHDCRHYWATQAARIANEGVLLGR